MSETGTEQVWRAICMHVVAKVVDTCKANAAGGDKRQLHDMLADKREFVALVVQTVLDEVSDAKDHACGEGAFDTPPLESPKPTPPVVPFVGAGILLDIERAESLAQRMRQSISTIRDLRLRLRQEFDEAISHIESAVECQSDQHQLDHLAASTHELELAMDTTYQEVN